MEIVSIPINDFREVTSLYKVVIKSLREKYIFQWDRFYPNQFIIFRDLKNNHFFGVKEDNRIVGVVVLNTSQSKQYVHIDWEDQLGRPLCIHRLAVHPNDQGKGAGKKLIQFAEDYARNQGFSSLRLDAYSKNPGAVALYDHAGFSQKGNIYHPFRKVPYQCFEKILAKREKETEEI